MKLWLDSHKQAVEVVASKETMYLFLNHVVTFYL